jgi:phage virion morphogenesis protein
VTGVRLEISIDDGGLGRAMERALRELDDLRPVLDASAGVMEASIERRFSEGRAPGGIPWPPSVRARQTGGKTLIDSGSLRESIGRSVTENQVEVGSTNPGPGDSDRYAAVHQFGAHITPKKGEFLVFAGGDGGLVFARSVTIPARPFIGIDDQDVADLSDLWEDAVAEAFNGG